jgi:hypothetical protein
MNYNRNGTVKAIRYDGDNYQIILDMYKEHVKTKDKGMADPPTLCLYCSFGKIEIMCLHKLKKGDWFIMDERGWPLIKTNKMFKQMFKVIEDTPLSTNDIYVDKVVGSVVLTNNKKKIKSLTSKASTALAKKTTKTKGKKIRGAK